MRQATGLDGVHAITPTDHNHIDDDDHDDDDDNIVFDTLRVLGVLRKKVDRPAVGRKAYVRWWERLRALIVLSGIVVVLGIALASVIGITVLGFGFLLEQAIS